MQNHQPHSTRHVGQTVLVIVGVLGALAAFDAVLLGSILLIAAGPGAYGGLPLAASAFVTAAGVGVAGTAYTLLTTRSAEREAGSGKAQA
jgi:hypothetical protein